MSGPGGEVGDAAHDLNNACATLLGFAMLSRESVEPGTSLASYIDEILQAAQAAAGVAARLRALSERLRQAEDGAAQPDRREVCGGRTP